MALGKRWTREELLIALNLYHKLTFGRLHARQPAIIEVAQRMGRHPNSLAMKLCNLASLDPVLQLSGRKGLSGVSALDREAWFEYHANLDEAVPAGESAFRDLFGVGKEEQVEVIPEQGVMLVKRPVGATERHASVKVRRGQDYFRQVVLNNFDGRCGITGLPVRELLIAAHILPWSKHEEHRLDVRNGLCLSRLHDAAFEVGLIGFDSQMRLHVSPRIKEHLPQQTIETNFSIYEGEALRLPDDAVSPNEEFLKVHYSTRFRTA